MFAPQGWITIDEGLIRHASSVGWYKRPDGSADFSQQTLDYFLINFRNGNLMNPAWGDYANWRRAVADGIARSAGVPGQKGDKGDPGQPGAPGVSPSPAAIAAEVGARIING